MRNFCTRFLIHSDLKRLKLGFDCVLDGLGDLVGVYTLALGQSLDRSGEGGYLRLELRELYGVDTLKPVARLGLVDEEAPDLGTFLLYKSDAADDQARVDHGARLIIK